MKKWNDDFWTAMLQISTDAIDGEVEEWMNSVD